MIKGCIFSKNIILIPTKWRETKAVLDLPALSCLRTSQTLQLKSSYPPSNRRPDLEKATDVIPQMILSWEYIPISWSARISNNRHVASSDPVAKAYPLGKYCKIQKTMKSLSKNNPFFIKNLMHKFNSAKLRTLTEISLISVSWQ